MTREELTAQIRKKQSYLCVGLDADFNRLPRHLLDEKDPVFEFNKAIIDATKDLCVAYKPNLAFYEALGSKGWESLRKTMDYIPDEHFTIADAKRGTSVIPPGSTHRLSLAKWALMPSQWLLTWAWILYSLFWSLKASGSFSLR